jgi:hypothetical protein
LRPGQTVLHIKEISNTGKSMELVVSNGLTCPPMTERLLTTKSMAKESTRGVMAECMRDSGEIIK